MMRRSSMKYQTSQVMMKRTNSSIPLVPTKNSKAVEFPTSPQPEVGQEITHYAHPQHLLAEVKLSDLFTCAGCKEYGAGKRFACQQCDFQLHEFCAFSPPVLKNHPLHGQHQVVLQPKPAKSGYSTPRCDICAKSNKGFTFKCKACSFQMHPCCAMLSTEIKFPIHPHSLKILPPFNTSIGDNAVTCSECKKKKSGRMYRCTVCDYHLHADCAKSLINGLQASGIALPQKPGVMGTAAKLASQVAIGFIGGLIEGLGEGMGEMLVQNMTRGRSVDRRTIQH